MWLRTTRLGVQVLSRAKAGGESLRGYHEPGASRRFMASHVAVAHLGFTLKSSAASTSGSLAQVVEQSALGGLATGGGRYLINWLCKGR